jgi:NAD dependent epimerase/dehydratase family enzyme
MSGDVLGSQRVLPSRLLDSGFAFAFPSIDAALRSALR